MQTDLLKRKKERKTECKEKRKEEAKEEKINWGKKVWDHNLLNTVLKEETMKENLLK